MTSSALRRAPIYADNVASTSHPLATQAALETMRKGGNAVDGALAAAAVLTVVEPTGCGLGSDLFAIVWDGHALHGLNASGRSPCAWTSERFPLQMPQTGWDSVTVPGMVAGWVSLAGRFGKLTLGEVFAPAIRYAREGFIVTPVIASEWQAALPLSDLRLGFSEAFLIDGHAPLAGQQFSIPDLANSLELIAETNGDAFYRGELAERIIAYSDRHRGAMSLSDLADHRSEWVDPIEVEFAGCRVVELPPNGQGVGSLVALGILDALGMPELAPDDPQLHHLMIEATKLGLADIQEHVADPASVRMTPASLLSSRRLAEKAASIDPSRASDVRRPATGRAGTVCLATGDADGRMVSLIQSNYMGFGSGVVVPRTGISMQNRGAGFVLEHGHPNQVGPGKRPLHTIIPGFALDGGGDPLMAFTLMGGPMQAQGHVQMAVRILRCRQSPQAASDAPRWQVQPGNVVQIEEEFPQGLAEALGGMGHRMTREAVSGYRSFGGAQIVMRLGAGYVSGSDHRKDGHASGF